MEEASEYEHLKFMYNNIYDELNRARDWPIKAFQATTLIYSVIVITFLSLNISNTNINLSVVKAGIILIIAFVSTYIIIVIKRQHKQYLVYRDIQRRLQRKMGIHKIKLDNEPLFSNEFTDCSEHFSNLYKIKARYGYWFYIFYILSISVAIIVLISLK